MSHREERFFVAAFRGRVGGLIACAAFVLLAGCQAYGARRGPTVMLEIWPVFLEGSSVYALQPMEGDSWVFRLSGSEHPHVVVEQALSRLGVRPTVTHSTSWRFQDRALVLTYIAVLPTDRVPRGFRTSKVPPTSLVRGEATAPPVAIPSRAVLAHALEHLAWLNRVDPAVRKSLGATWSNALALFSPAPALEFGDPSR